MAFLKLPRLGTIDPTDKREFGRYWDGLCTEIEDSFNRIITLEDGALTLGLRVDDVSAGGLFQVIQGPTIAGTQATAELRVRAGLLEAFREAVIRLSALAGVESRIDIDADGVYVNGVLLSGGGLTTPMLAANAATEAESEDFSGIASTNDTNWNDLTTTGITRVWTGEKLDIDISVTVHNADAGDHPAQLRILKDGVVLKSWPTAGTEAFTCQKSGYSAPFPTAWHDTPTVASHTYKLQWRNPSVGTTVLTAEGTLRIDEIKR